MTEDELVIEWQRDNPHISFKTWLIDGINEAIAYKANESLRIAAAVQAEREACAMVCFSAGIHTVSYNLTGDTGRGYNFAMRDIAAAIRARSNNGAG